VRLAYGTLDDVRMLWLSELTYVTE